MLVQYNKMHRNRVLLVKVSGYIFTILGKASEQLRQSFVFKKFFVGILNSEYRGPLEENPPNRCVCRSAANYYAFLPAAGRRELKI